MPEKKNELLRELKAKMGCGDIEEGTTDFYDFMDKVIDHHPKISPDKKEEIKAKVREADSVGDIWEMKDDYEFLNK